MIDKAFIGCITRILDYLVSEEKHFLENPSASHVFTEALRAKVFINESVGISRDVATELVKLQIPDLQVMCFNSNCFADEDENPYEFVNNLDLDEDGNLPEEWTDFIVTLK